MTDWTRRGFVSAGTAAMGGSLMAQTRPAYDYAVVGAGVFGAWLARMLHSRGKRVALLDQYGPASNRASSGGETRIIRFGYGDREIYTRWSQRALALYKEFYRPIDPTLFQETGFLWLARPDDAYTAANLPVFEKLGVRYEKLSADDLRRRFPQIELGPITWGIYEPEAGGLLARRGVQTVVRETAKEGVTYLQTAVSAPSGGGRSAVLQTASGERIAAGEIIYACGPWLPKVFPELLGDRIRPTRQEVFYFGVEPGDSSFRPPAMPSWVDPGDTIYGLPDIETRGFKIAPDQHGPKADPDSQQRLVSPGSVDAVRAYLRRRFPKLADAPLVQTEVCQYENTANGDYLLDRHPGYDNVWLMGGGSGHGYKHGPAVGEYFASALVDGTRIDPRFSLEAKERIEDGGRQSTIPAPK